jgi:serine/threonine protein kinase
MATIGKGGMGAVYLALDTHMSNQQVAIKEMSQTDLRDPKALHRARQSFQQEATMLHQLQHPNLPKVYTSFEEQDRSYLVMEYIPGDTLFQTLKQRRNRILPVSSVIEYGRQLSAVLAYLHTRPQPIIYLDLKPPNIMLRKDNGRVLLIDFGIAHFFQPGLTLAGEEVFMTQGYAPPEQMIGKPEPRSDLFALGATLHYCLTGQNPQAHLKEHLFDFPPVQPFHSQVPDALNILISQMLNVDPQSRPASASMVQHKLEQIRLQMVEPVVLGTVDVISDPEALTVPQKDVVSQHSLTKNHQRVVELFPQPGRRLGPLLLASLSTSWKQARAMVSNQKIWDQRFAALLLAILVLSTGSSFAFLQTAPDAPHIHALGYMLTLFVLGILGFQLTRKRLDDPVPRTILGLMGLTLVFVTLTLQSLPDMEALVHPLIQNAALNKVCLCGLLIVAALSLARPEKSFTGVDHLLLGMLTAGCALWQYGFGQNELAQFPGFTPNLTQEVNAGLIWGLLVLALLCFLLFRKPFSGWSRFGLVLVASIFTAFQYTSSFNEFQSFHLTGTPLIILSFTYTWLPLLFAVLAWITRRTWLTRVALCTLAVAEATMLYAQGQQVFFSFLPATPYPLSITILASPTLYQLLGPILILLSLLTLLLLPNKGGFRWFDHSVLLLEAFVCARLDDAFWQAQHGLSTPTIDPGTMHQQYIGLAGLIPAYLIYWLLGAYLLALSAIIACHFWRQSNPSARIEPWLKRFQALLTFIDRLLSLALLSIAFLILGSLGIFSILSRTIESGHFASSSLTPLLVFTLLLLVILAILTILLLVRLLRRKTYELGKSERLTLFFSALTCLLFIWQTPHAGTLPLLARHVQLIGNIFHLPSATLYLSLLGELMLISCLAFFWLRRSFFANYRALLNLPFLLVLACAFLQLIWPIFLPLGLLFLIPAVLLAVQIEKAG